MAEEAKPEEEEHGTSGKGSEEKQPPPSAENVEREKTSGEAGLHVDEDWKAQAAREKEELRRREQKEPETRREEVGEHSMPPADFNSLVASFATQALIQMGQVENPLTGERRIDLSGARYTIDLLDMLKKKTSGNLEPEEERQIDAILYDLKMRFVKTQQQPPSPAPGEPETKPQA